MSSINLFAYTTNVLFADATFTPDEYHYLQKKKQITMCIDPNWMPFEKIENGNHKGMTSEHFKLFEEKIGIPIVLVPTKTWSESIEFAKQRKCDIFSLAMETKERKAYMNFTQPYLEAPLVITTRMHTTFIADPKDVIEEPLGITKGYAFSELLKEKYPTINLVEFETLDEGLDALREGKIFGYIDNLITSGYKIQQKYFGELKIAGKFSDTWSLGIGVRNDDLMLLQIFDKVLKLVKYKEYNTIINDWISVRYDKGFDYDFFWKMLAVLSVIALFILYRHVTMQKYIAQLREKEEALKLLSITDSLTGLYNRRHFDTIISHEFDRAKRKNQPLTFALLDIDFFKKYNDTYGHQLGDEALKRIGGVLGSFSKRAGDYAFRVGGEEFAIVLHAVDDEECTSYFDRLRNSIENLNIEHRENLPYGCVTVSIGVTKITHYENVTPDALYKFTDNNLYSAKENGRNQIQKKVL
ncbi:MAG: diguanylate cyclase [Campylobacterota bacterium]|nr:diguanylate cyclase [Campylobacterota bacterium]